MERLERLLSVVAGLAFFAVVFLVAIGPAGRAVNNLALSDAPAEGAGRPARARSLGATDAIGGDSAILAHPAAPGAPLSSPRAESIPDPSPGREPDVRGSASSSRLDATPSSRDRQDGFRPEAAGGVRPRAARPESQTQAVAGAQDAREMPRPVGRFDIWTHGMQWHAVLTLGAGSAPSFMNYGYFHPGYSREDVKAIRWDAPSRTLAFAREFAPRIRQNYKLVFRPDLSFEGSPDGEFDCRGGPRADLDVSPMPQGLYEIVCPESGFRGHLRIAGSDPAQLEGAVDYGAFHAGYAEEQLSDVQWDAENATLSFFRGSCSQWTWLTFREEGRAFYGTFTWSGKYWSYDGSRL